MTRRLLGLSLFISAFWAVQPTIAADLPTCVSAGPGAEFCAAATFNRLDVGQTDGIGLWLHKGGFLSKTIVQADPQGLADQGVVESRILALVSDQAGRMGRDFQFSDVASASVGGNPFGTLSYALAGADGDQNILHSYVVAEGIVLQVITQIALTRASRDPRALAAAHSDAIRAVRLADTSPEA